MEYCCTSTSAAGAAACRTLVAQQQHYFSLGKWQTCSWCHVYQRLELTVSERLAELGPRQRGYFKCINAVPFFVYCCTAV